MNDFLTNVVTIQEAVAAGVARAFADMGIKSEEISYRKARETFGAAFTQLCNENKIQPCRYGEKAKYYLISDIRTAIAAERATVRAKLNIF